MSNMFQVTDPLGNIELDCGILDIILESNGINSDSITQSYENDNEWIVQISENEDILEKKNYQLQGLHDEIRYCLCFLPLREAQPNLSAGSQAEDLSNQLCSFSLIDDQNSTGNLGQEKSDSYHIPNQTMNKVPLTSFYVDTEQKIVSEPLKSVSSLVLSQANHADSVTNLDVDDEQDSVLVKNVPIDFDLKFLHIFLENEKLSGGGKIRNLRKIRNSTDIEVTFENKAVIGRVLKNSPMKFNNLTFPIIRKPKVNEARKESEESEEKIIEVHGVPVDMDLEIVKLYFENHKKSGGGKITKDLIRDKITGTVLIEFVSSEDAIEVVNKVEHVFNQQTFTVNLYQSLKGKCFFLSDVKTGLQKDSILNFLEAKADIWVEDIIKMEAENTWMVYCNDIVNFSQVQQLCKTHTIDFISDTYPKVSSVPACYTILTSTLLPKHGLSEEIIQLYFQACTHEGQDVKIVRKLPAQRFLITFDDPAVVSEVCQRSHKIMDIEFQVMPYYKNLINDGNYGDYLLDSSLKFELMEKYHRTVETMLQPHVKPIWSKSNGQVLKIEYSKDISQEEALKKVENLLQNVHEETIKLSAEMLEKAKQFIQKETLNAIVSLDPSDQTLKIAAFGQDTLRQYKESFVSSSVLTCEESKTILMDSHKISLLFAEKFPQKTQVKYPGIKIQSGKQKIIINGTASKFSDVETDMYKFLKNIQCIAVRLPKYASYLLNSKEVKSYIIWKLKKEKCSASWEIKEDDLFIVYSLQANQLANVVAILESCIKALNFGPEDPLKDVMVKRKWEEFRQRIQNIHKNLCYFDRKTLTGVTVDYLEEKIRFEFENIFQKNVKLEKLVLLEMMQADYIKKKKMNDINEFCRKFGTENPVTMTIQPDNKLCITASAENMDKASEFIGEILKGFKDIKHMMEYHGIKNDEKKKKSASRKRLLTIYQMKYANVTIIIYQGDITQLSVDAIVNATNKEMDHGEGLAKAIINAGGFKIQDELASLNSKSIAVGDAIITSGGDLPCKHVIHAVGPIWKGGSNNEALLLSKAIQKSLEIADVYTLASIAFPAISTGKYAYPLAQAADVMISAVKEYLDKNSKTTLTTISFVDTRSVVTAEFHRQIDQGFFPKLVKKEEVAPTAPLVSSKPMSEPSQSDLPRKKLSLIIKRGELEKIKADIIVNSIPGDMNFSKGQLASAILRSAGKEIETECKNTPDLGPFQVIITKGYQLPCEIVFHIKLSSDKIRSKKIIQKYMEQCLATADIHNASSIAFPSLGTGQLNYPPEVVAKVMLTTAYYHLNTSSTSLKEIYMIIYPKDDHIFQAFQRESNNLIKIPGINIGVEKGMNVTESVKTIQKIPLMSTDTPSGMRTKRNLFWPQLSYPKISTPLTKSPDLILGTVQIFVINGDLLDQQTDAIVHCTDAQFRLRGAISRCLTRKIGAAFSQDCLSKSSEMLTNHVAAMKVNYSNYKYILHLDVVSKLSEPDKIIQTCFHEAEKLGISSISFPQLANHGQSVPLDQMAAAMVEVISKFKFQYLKEVNVVLYQSKMVASFKNDIQSAYKTYTSGGSNILWRGSTLIPKKMVPSDILKVIPLQKDDAEYKKVQKEFLSSLRRNSTILSIEKIENKPLKMQYEAQLLKIKALNTTILENERTLWHGTKEETVLKICKDGFDRGYCGVNGTYHGLGVYFAVHSEYSDKDKYSPPDANGNKHMLMCRVGTGVYVQGTSSMKVLPTRPNSTLKYDSATNKPTNPTVFIIFNDVQAYPEYHITYS